MLDDLREQAGETDFLFEEEDEEVEVGDGFDYSESSPAKSSPELLLGMTPVQRFVIAAMILMMTCIMGSFLLLVTEKIVLPFF